jgi:hypothetical protein
MIKPSRLLVLGLLLVGCNDGPTAVGTVFDDAGATDLGTPADRGTPGDNGAVTDNGTPADRGNPADNGTPTDTPIVTDNGVVDAGTPDTGTVDAGTPDTGVPDAGTPDIGTVDAGTPDVGTPDAGAMDAGLVDAGPTDAGPTDAGTADTGATCTPAAETCNGLDDDCDGVIDESGCGTHLLITEVVLGPDEGEFIEIHNPTSAAVDLANVYLTDFHDYACYLGRACTVTGRTMTALASSDFVARFPAGATLAPGAYATVAIKANLTLFRGIAGVCPTYYLAGASGDAGLTVGTCTASLPMRPTAHATNTIQSAAGLTNGGEPVLLFQWDGVAPLPTDLDYVFVGAASGTNIQVDRTTTSLALAADAGSATFLADTVPASQQRVAVPSNVNGAAAVRCNFAEGTERRTGGNGLGGHDETSEPLATTWQFTATPAQVDGSIAALNATPGAVNNCR